MGIIGIDINQIVELGTHVATVGAIGAGEVARDKVFEYIISVAVVIYETHPTFN